VIVDVHTHLWPEAATPQPIAEYLAARESPAANQLSYEGLLASMEKSGIERSVVVAMAFSAAMSNEDIAPLNAYVRHEAAKSRGALIPFCTVNPFEDRATTRALRRAIEEHGFQGLKLHPSLQEFYPNDDRLHSVYGIMEEYRLPILFHSGGIGVRPYRDKYGDPSLFDDVGTDFPELLIVLGHAGRNRYDLTAALLRKHPNVYADVSTNFGRDVRSRLEPIGALISAVRGWAGTTDHLLFGSDYPLYTQAATLSNLRELQKERAAGRPGAVEAEDVRRIVEVNSNEFLHTCFARRDARSRSSLVAPVQAFEAGSSSSQSQTLEADRGDDPVPSDRGRGPAGPPLPDGADRSAEH
jgi:predicted TIM-barrel fold metal-dependent hydrolase